MAVTGLVMATPTRHISRPLSESIWVIIDRSQRTKKASSGFAPCSAPLCHSWSRTGLNDNYENSRRLTGVLIGYTSIVTRSFTQTRRISRLPKLLTQFRFPRYLRNQARLILRLDGKICPPRLFDQPFFRTFKQIPNGGWS